MIYLHYKDTKTFGHSFSFLLIFKTLRASYLQVGNFSKVLGIAKCIKATKEETLKIRSFNGFITISNADEGELVNIYTATGTSVGTAIIRNGQAYVETHIKPGSIAIVKVGCKTMKIIMQ